MRSRDIETLRRDPEYKKLDARKRDVFRELSDLDDMDMSYANATKWDQFEGKKRVLQNELYLIANRMMELANMEFEEFFPSKLDKNAPIQEVGNDLFSLIK